MKIFEIPVWVFLPMLLTTRYLGCNYKMQIMCQCTYVLAHWYREPCITTHVNGVQI